MHFTVTNPEIHHYQIIESRKEDQSQQKEDSVEPPSIQHQWKDPSQFNYSDEDTKCFSSTNTTTSYDKTYFCPIIEQKQRSQSGTRGIDRYEIKARKFQQFIIR